MGNNYSYINYHTFSRGTTTQDILGKLGQHLFVKKYQWLKHAILLDFKYFSGLGFISFESFDWYIWLSPICLIKFGYSMLEFCFGIEISTLLFPCGLVAPSYFLDSTSIFINNDISDFKICSTHCCEWNISA